MKARTRRVAVPWCMAVLLAGSTACIERKDSGGAGQQASSDQTEAVLARVVPGTVDFSMRAQQIVELSLAAGGGDCPRIPGAGTSSLCASASTGVVCQINSNTKELRFNGCNAGGTSIDGTMRVVGPSRGPVTVTFNLSLGGRSATGQMTMDFGGCDELGYGNLRLNEAQVSSTLAGELRNCNGAPGGDFTATVSSSSMQPFIAHVTFSGSVATIAVTDLESQAALYQCTWSPSSPGTADCQEPAA